MENETAKMAMVGSWEQHWTWCLAWLCKNGMEWLCGFAYTMPMFGENGAMPAHMQQLDDKVFDSSSRAQTLFNRIIYYLSLPVSINVIIVLVL